MELPRGQSPETQRAQRKLTAGPDSEGIVGSTFFLPLHPASRSWAAEPAAVVLRRPRALPRGRMAGELLVGLYAVGVHTDRTMYGPVAGRRRAGGEVAAARRAALPAYRPRRPAAGGDAAPVGSGTVEPPHELRGHR